MSNYSDNGSQYNNDSVFDNLMQSLGLDPHQHSTPEPTNPDFSLYDSFGQQTLGADLHHSGWNLGHTHFHNSFQQDLTHSNWSELSHTSNFDHPTPEFQTGWTDLGHSNHYQLDGTDWHQPDHYQTPEQVDYSAGYQPHHDFGGMEHQVHQISFHSAAIEKSDPNSVRLYSDGEVRWESGGQAGHIEGQKFYNFGNHYIGRLGEDLKVYDANDKCIGSVDPSGHAYTTNGTVFASGGKALWAAAVLVFNTCGRS